MSFQCKKTSTSELDPDSKPYRYEFVNDTRSWEDFEAEYELRAEFGCTFERVSDREFIFVTSNATHCRFVRTDV